MAHSKQGIFISQQKYVLDLLKEAEKLGCEPVDTPLSLTMDYAMLQMIPWQIEVRIKDLLEG